MKFRPPPVYLVAPLVALMVPIFFLLLFIGFRTFYEARYIPSSAMQPTLKIGDRLIIEKIKVITHKPFKRGEIIVFYPPAIETGSEPGTDILHQLGRLTGLPFFPNDPAFIKRIIGLPGDKIEVLANQGVLVNGKMLVEPYVQETVAYDLVRLGDIGGRNAQGKIIRPYADRAGETIVVPPDNLFVLGDNRNNSEDSHVWGFLPTSRVIGIAASRLEDGQRFDPPDYGI